MQHNYLHSTQYFTGHNTRLVQPYYYFLVNNNRSNMKMDQAALRNEATQRVQNMTTLVVKPKPLESDNPTSLLVLPL